jgi:hypothetical protein
MTPVIVGAALALLALDAAPADTSTPTTVKPAVVTAAQDKDDPLADLDKVTCRKEAITGSRFVKRTCMTKAQWNEQDRETEDFKRRVTQHVDGPQSNGMGGSR